MYADLPDPMRVTLSDGRQLQLARPYIEGDTLRGTGPGTERVALARADVVRVERWKNDPVFILAACAGAFAFFLVGLSTTDSFP